MNRLSGKVALVTGGARGIGRATAELFATHGAQVIAADLGPPSQPFTNPHVRFAALDVSREADWKRAVQAIKEQYGTLAILVNNAGVTGTKSAIDQESLSGWNQALEVNLTGVFLGMREAIPVMRAGGGGSIVNFSSIWGIAAVEGGASYHASKGAVRHLTKNAAVTYANIGIRVNSIHPGIVATPMVIEEQPKNINEIIVAATPMGRMAQPIELAYGCLFLASDESSFMTGAELVIDGGYLAR